MTTSPNSPALKIAPNLALSVAALLGSLAPAAVLIVLGQPATAQAAPTPRAEVRIELEAKTPNAVLKEVSTAARNVCEAVTTHSPLEPRALTECRKDAEGRAMDQINPRPSLLASRD